MNTAALPAKSGGVAMNQLIYSERKYQAAPIREQQENMSLSMTRIKAALGQGRGEGLECQEESRAGRRSGRAQGRR